MTADQKDILAFLREFVGKSCVINGDASLPFAERSRYVIEGVALSPEGEGRYGLKSATGKRFLVKPDSVAVIA
jgi:hypothetical protein